MTIDASGSSTLIARVKAILMRPAEEWPVIAGETTSSGDIFTRYAIPLAAIGPVCAFLGGQIFGYGGFGYHIRPSLFGSLCLSIVTFLLSLVSLFILSFIAGRLAPRFGGESSTRNAFKLVAYSMTASWVAGVFGLIPSLAIFGLLGLYSFYLFYTGAQPMLNVPRDKAMTYTVVTVLCAILLNLVVGALAAGAVGLVGGFGGSGTAGEGSVITLPGGATIDTGKMEQAAHDMEAAVKEGGNGKAVPASALQSLLPAAIGRYSRTSIESVAAGPGGTHAEATYEAGDRRIKLSVHDMAALGAVAGIGAALGVESNKEEGDSYERTSTRDGKLTVEKWDGDDHEGSYATMVDKRFMIEAEGEANSIDELKAAVATVDAGRLAALGK